MSDEIDLADLGIMAKKAQGKVNELSQLASSATDLGERFERLKASEGRAMTISTDISFQTGNGVTYRVNHFSTDDEAEQIRDLLLKLMAKRLRFMLDNLYSKMDRLNK
jgi:hypothetical protein